MADLVLTLLLMVSMVLSVMLIIVSTAALGRKLADLEYQELAGLDGVRKIQSWINVRMQANRIFLGLTFIVFSSLLLAGAPEGLRTWAFRIMFALLLAGFVVSALLDWRAERHQLQILMREQPSASVDVATIQPAAVEDIAAAVRPEVAKDIISAVTDALPATDTKP